MKASVALATLSTAVLWGSGDTLQTRSQTLLWSGAVTRGGGITGEVPECAPGCDRFDPTLDLPNGVWNNRPGGVQVAIRWAGATFGDNLRLYVYRGNTLIAKSDGIIAIAQTVTITAPADGALRVYVAYGPDSTANPISYEGWAEVEYEPDVHPIRPLLPDMAARPQRNLSFDRGWLRASPSVRYLSAGPACSSLRDGRTGAISSDHVWSAQTCVTRRLSR